MHTHIFMHIFCVYFWVKIEQYVSIRFSQSSLVFFILPSSLSLRIALPFPSLVKVTFPQNQFLNWDTIHFSLSMATWRQKVKSGRDGGIVTHQWVRLILSVMVLLKTGSIWCKCPTYWQVLIFISSNLSYCQGWGHANVDKNRQSREFYVWECTGL